MRSGSSTRVTRVPRIEPGIDASYSVPGPVDRGRPARSGSPGAAEQAPAAAERASEGVARDGAAQVDQADGHDEVPAEAGPAAARGAGDRVQERDHAVGGQDDQTGDG